MKFTGFIGPSYQLNSVNVDCQRCINLYPEIIESGSGKGGDLAYLKSTPGLRILKYLPFSRIRLIHVDPQGRILAVGSQTMHLLSFDGTNWASVFMGGLETTSGTVIAASAIQGDTFVTVFVDGVNNYVFKSTLISPFITYGTFASLSLVPVLGATHVALIDGYFIFNKKGTNQFFVSEWQSLSVDPLSFASAEGDPDNIVGLIANNRDLWLFGDRTIEIWTDTGNADFPFERMSGGFIEKGCLAGYSIAKMEGHVFWLGRDEFGQGMVYMAQGLSPQRISTHAIEQAINSYANPSAATAYCYQSGGHSFYVLNFAENTWVYDFATKLWHERCYLNAGNLERHRGESHCFVPQYGIHLVGDYENSAIYMLDDNYYLDGYNPIMRKRVSPHVSSDLKIAFHKRLTIDMETGIGLDGRDQGSDPQVIMTYSNDGGHTWSSEMSASAGKKIGGIGNFKARVFWNRLGSSRDRVYSVQTTEPVPITLLSADLDVEVGGS